MDYFDRIRAAFDRDKGVHDTAGDSIKKSTNAVDVNTRIVRMEGVIDDAMANSVIAQLLFHQMQDLKAPVEIVVESPGGLVAAGLAIIDTILSLTMPVYTETRGCAFAMALAIVSLGQKGHRKCTLRSEFGFVKLVAKTPFDVRAVRAFAKINQRLINVFQETTGQSRRQIASDMEVNRVFTAEEALNYGLVDLIEWS